MGHSVEGRGSDSNSKAVVVLSDAKFGRRTHNPSPAPGVVVATTMETEPDAEQDYVEQRLQTRFIAVVVIYSLGLGISTAGGFGLAVAYPLVGSGIGLAVSALYEIHRLHRRSV